MYTHPNRFCSEDNTTFINGKAETFLISEVSLLPESPSVIFADRMFFEKRKWNKTTAARTMKTFGVKPLQCLYFAKNLSMNRYYF